MMKGFYTCIRMERINCISFFFGRLWFNGGNIWCGKCWRAMTLYHMMPYWCEQSMATQHMPLCPSVFTTIIWLNCNLRAFNTIEFGEFVYEGFWQWWTNDHPYRRNQNSHHFYEKKELWNKPQLVGENMLTCTISGSTWCTQKGAMIGNDFSINGFIVEQLGYFLLKSNNYDVKKHVTWTYKENFVKLYRWMFNLEPSMQVHIQIFRDIKFSNIFIYCFQWIQG